MPALYTHDVFGNLVFEKLSGYSKEIASKYYESFRIGLQGPDPLLYYRPYGKNDINTFGDALHKLPVYLFLEKAFLKLNAIGTDSSSYAYLIGFLCHFTLDRECHPYVDEYALQNEITHVFLESELDKYILKKQNLDPLKIDVSKIVSTDENSARALASFYDVLDLKKAKEVLNTMKLERRILYTPNNVKYYSLLTLFNTIKPFHSFKDMMFLKEDSYKCEESNHYLYKRMLESVTLAVTLIKEVEEALLDNKTLSKEFYRDFETTKQY